MLENSPSLQSREFHTISPPCCPDVPQKVRLLSVVWRKERHRYYNCPMHCKGRGVDRLTITYEEDKVTTRHMYMHTHMHTHTQHTHTHTLQTNTADTADTEDTKARTHTCRHTHTYTRIYKLCSALWVSCLNVITM